MTKADYADKIIKRYPDAPAMTLAKMAIRDFPGVFKNVGNARGAICRALGVWGKKNRREATNKSQYRKKRRAGYSWRQMIPETLAKPWSEFDIPGKNRALILSDIHIPFHDPEALELALTAGEKKNPTLIVLNGDVMDHYAASRWETDPQLRDLAGEVIAGRKFLAGLRKRFPRARIVLKEGNHENRLIRYIRVEAPELAGIPDFEWDAIFKLKEYRIEYVKDMRPITLGKLTLLHGHEYVFQISNPVNPARGLFLRGKANAMCGHFHATSQHSEKNLEQKVISTWSVGCLCNLHPAYRPLNQWNHGFAFVEVDKSGAFHVENYRVMEGKVW